MKAITLSKHIRLGSPNLPVYIQLKQTGYHNPIMVPISKVKLVEVVNKYGKKDKVIAICSKITIV